MAVGPDPRWCVTGGWRAANGCPPCPRRPRPVPATALVVLALCAACGDRRSAQTAAPPPPPVVVGQVVRKTAPVVLRAIGHVEPIATVQMRARVGGELTRVWFTEGQSVARGAILFTIDARQYQAALREAEARVARDQAQLKKAEIDVTRYAGLVKQDYVTKEQYDQMTTNVASLKALVEADAALVDNARLQVDYCTIAAPMAGRTGNLMVKAGNLVKANDDKALVSINQMRPIYVSFSVPQQFLPEILRRGARALEVSATIPETSAPAQRGELTFVDNNVDTATSTILLKATFANEDDALWPGQFVTVVLTLGEEPNRVVVPSAAVQTSQQGQYVFVIKDDGIAELRLVKVNRMDEADAVIDEGLNGGERVVTEGHLRVVPGQRVQIRQPAASRAAS